MDWSNPTVQVAALGISGAILAALLAGVFATVSALVAGRVSANASRDTAAMAVNADAAARAEIHRVQLDEVQRATLLELQEQLKEWWSARIHVHQADLYRMNSPDQQVLPELDVLDQTAYQLGGRVNVLTQRVRDEALRQALRDLISDAADLEEHRRGSELLDAGFRQLFDKYYAAQEHVGVVLRTYL